MTAIDRFRAMGTEIEVLGPPHHPAAGAATARVRARFETEEQRFSRFRPDSELTLVNRRSGRRTPVSDAFAGVTRMAIDAATRTDGRFDPTVHDALVAAGYDRDFDEVLAGARGQLHSAIPCGRWSEIDLRGDGTLTMPRGLHLDLGGIAKGWTADRAVEDALEAGLPWALVNAGGDLRVGGDPLPILVAVDDPFRPGTAVADLRLTHGAVATSSVLKRSWGDGAHHIIDPVTGAPADTDVVQATVWAPTCAEAEVLATSTVLLGRAALETVAGVLVTGGEVLVSMAMGVAA